MKNYTATKGQIEIIQIKCDGSNIIWLYMALSNRTVPDMIAILIFQTIDNLNF